MQGRIPKMSVVVALVLGGAGAPAQGDDYEVITEWISLGDSVLGADESIGFDATPIRKDITIVGFELEFDYGEDISDNSWASDLQVDVKSPSGHRYLVGGLTSLPMADENWSFQGPGSDEPGPYGGTGDDVFMPWKKEPVRTGDFFITITNDWATDPNPNCYNGVRIRFYANEIPNCEQDLDGNGFVDFGDVLPILVAWGPCAGCPEDLDDSGYVDFGDVIRVLVAWGPCTE